ncbi:GGDEF domain-containing protein [Bdellovibrio sp. HCB209]|uniref:GGDEF domain-containing protein n=1 Tax=Bdellovibrio sp. HCB209 TaxID=3394354 RepID=UPI0039B591EF
MDIRDHSSQFTVYVFTSDVDQGAAAKVALSQAGYDAYFIQDPEQLEQRLNDTPPHLLVFATATLDGALSDFVVHVQKINDEIRFIAISNLGQFDILSQYQSFGFMDVISDDPAAMDNRVLWAVDRACEKLFLTMQNEQMYEDLETTKQQMEDVHAAALKSMQQQEQAESRPAFPMRIADYRSAQSKEDIIQRFLNNISSSRCLFFKFLPSVRSFVATHANGVDAAQIQGVGSQLTTDEMKDLGTQLAMGLIPPNFSQMVVEAFHLNPPKAIPLYANSHLEGLFVYSGGMDAKDIEHLNDEYTLFNLCYSHFVLEKKVDALEVQDFVTELYNRNHYVKILDEEVARGRRLKQPLAIVKIAMDDFYEIESSLGEAVRDELLKSLATVIAKSSRTNDTNFRTAANELTMVLPHCSKKGAALRAERVRRVVEGSSFLDNGMKISISLGVSEYPSLCDSAKTLDETAAKALAHIADKGGNKICLYKAPESHKPEFEIPAE